MAYATLADLRDWVGITRPEDVADDDKLELALDVATALIDNYTGRYFDIDSAVVTRVYTPQDRWTVDIPTGIATATGLVVATDNDDDGIYETTWSASDYRLGPADADELGRPWTRLYATGTRTFPVNNYGRRKWPAVQITAKGGWPAVPAEVKQACLIQAAFIWGRKDARFGVAGSPEFGNELRVETALDRTAQVLLKAYRQMWAAV